MSEGVEIWVCEVSVEVGEVVRRLLENLSEYKYLGFVLDRFDKEEARCC